MEQPRRPSIIPARAPVHASRRNQAPFDGPSGALTLVTLRSDSIQLVNSEWEYCASTDRHSPWLRAGSQTVEPQITSS